MRFFRKTGARRYARACDPASELSFDDILQQLAIERQIGNDFLQPAVLVLQLAQPRISDSISAAYFFFQLK